MTDPTPETAPEPTPDAAAPEGKGLGGLIRRRPNAWLAGVLSLAFVVLGTGAVYAGASRAANSPAAVAESPSASPTPTEEPPRPVPDAIAGPSRLRTCSIAALAADPRLAELSGYVMRADTGEVLFDRNGTTPARTGSVLKILTAAAAVAELGPGHQLSTKVVAVPDGTSVALVGGGDATLSALPPGVESFYRGAPKLTDLAQQVVTAWTSNHEEGELITEIVLDASYWNPADKWDPVWKRSEQTIGYHSEVTALQVDGDRADPSRGTSPRGTDPIGRAGEAFLTALRNAGDVVDPDVNVVIGTAPSGAQQLAEVKSQPVSALVHQMLLVSDNTIAEMLARVVSRSMGMDGSAASLQQAIPQALAGYGVDTAGLVIKDGSGLSEFNNVPPSYVAQLMVPVINGESNLNVVYDGLPIAGQTGSLASRFTGPNSIARGKVVAKTGWIDTAYSLGGVVTAGDGTRLTFAFYAIGNVSDNARTALDTLTTGVYNCGDNLSNQ